MENQARQVANATCWTLHGFSNLPSIICSDQEWLPLEADDLKELIGHCQTAAKPAVPIKPEELIILLNGLDSEPSLRLTVGLVALFGLRPAELMVFSVDDGNLKVGNVKRNAHSSATPKPPRTVQELPLRSSQVKEKGWCSS